MRNFFRNNVTEDLTIRSSREIAQLLDTTDEQLIRQYKKSLGYIKRVKDEIIAAGNVLLTAKRGIPAR